MIPQLEMVYLALAGTLSIPSITRKTDKGLPKYQDTKDSDVLYLIRYGRSCSCIIQKG